MSRAILAQVLTSPITLPTYAGYLRLTDEEYTVPASESRPYLQISVPRICDEEQSRAYWGVTEVTAETQHFWEIGSFLKEESRAPFTTYGCDDVQFHAHDGLFGFSNKLTWLYRLVQSRGVRTRIPCENAPELFMLMVEVDGLPNLEGTAAIAYARFLGESLTNWYWDDRSELGRHMHNGYLLPKRAKIEVHRQTRPASWPRITGHEGCGPYQVTVSVDPTYRRALVGPKGCNIRAITKALSAMVDATVHLQIKTM